MDPYLLLTLNGITVRFEGYIFEDGQLARQIEQNTAGTVSYSAYGAPIVDGAFSRPKHLWTFSIITDLILRYQPDLPDQVRELWAEYDRIRRTGAVPVMELEDSTEYFFETLPRTRALATGATEISTGGTRIKYYAKFNALFTRPPEFQIGEGFTIQLSEGDIVTP